MPTAHPTVRFSDPRIGCDEHVAALGIGWDPLLEDPADGTSDEVRVVGLPRALHVTGGAAEVCYGYFGPHEQIMAAERGVGVTS